MENQQPLHSGEIHSAVQEGEMKNYNDDDDDDDDDQGEWRWRHWWLDDSEDPRERTWQDRAGELLDTDQPLLSINIWMHRSGEIN